MNAEAFTVTLKKSITGQLGFRINLNGTILDIRSGSPADVDGNIEIGDTLIQINNKNISPEDGIIDLLRNLDQNNTFTFKRPIR